MVPGPAVAPAGGAWAAVAARAAAEPRAAGAAAAGDPATKDQVEKFYRKRRYSHQNHVKIFKFL